MLTKDDYSQLFESMQNKLSDLAEQFTSNPEVSVKLSALEQDLRILKQKLGKSSNSSTANDIAEVYSIVQDETNECQQLENGLQKSEVMAKNVMEELYCAMMIISPNMRILEANKQVRERFPHVDFSQKLFCYQIHNRTEPCSVCSVIETLQDGKIHERMYTLSLPEKKFRLRLIASPVRDEAGNIVAVVEMAEDITEKVLAEEEIRTLSHAVEQSPGITVITDTKGSITHVNAKFGQVTGYSAEEVIGQNPRFLSSGIHSDFFFKHLWDTITAGKEWRGELCNKKKNGELFWALTSISPVNNLDDKVICYLAVQQDITETKKLQEALHRIATTDELTGAVNRTQFMELGRQEIQRSLHYGHSLSVLFTDLDNFKKINDTYGHNVGDQTLIWFARHVREIIRDADVLGRIGGDEFAIILPETEIDDAFQVAERLRRTLESNHISLEDNKTICTTVSSGIASQEISNLSLEELLKKADAALYKAKEMGRNRVQVELDKNTRKTGSIPRMAI